MNYGSFVISLDFELMWGVRDKRTIENYGDALIGVKTAIIRMLESFKKHEVSVTFATVGFLFHKNREELLINLPDIKVNYTDKNLSPYTEISNYLGKNENDDPYYFGYSLLQLIKESDLHEVSTHTYCHYYCLEPGQTLDMFEADLAKAVEVANREGVQIKSIVFPRNQYSSEYIEICKKYGLTCYRGNEDHFIYKSTNGNEQTAFRRALRLIDGYFNITGYHCYQYSSIVKTYPHNIPASRFLRPYNKKLKFLENQKLRRITQAMTYAAKNNRVYHLWWHPHNFGRNTEENIIMMEKILEHYQFLKLKYQFQSTTIKDLSKHLITK
ncbi:MAG: polysaccharide deacetylase family protein [Flavobacteriaceae bacterium]|nr:polysaccharide deacetylase family protein [Flavobacteriaceae bacterium]